jgi:hypothetical protein
MPMLKFKEEIQAYLYDLVTMTQNEMRDFPKDFEQNDDGEPYQDIRLHCWKDSWTINIGCADYDQRHGRYIGASSICLDTQTDELTEELINQCEEQDWEIENANA